MNKVTVFGSFVTDLMMRAERLPVHGETVKGICFDTGAGGKGSNQGVAASLSGSEVVMITKIGDDEFGNSALKSFQSAGIDTKYIFRDDSLPTGAALIMVDDRTSENMIIVTLGACGNIKLAEIDSAIDDIRGSKVFLTQLETNLDAVYHGIKLAKSMDIPVILNPAPAERFDEELYKLIDYFTPNDSEAAYLSGIEIKSVCDAERAGKYFIDKGVLNCVFTLGSKGAFLYNKDTAELYEPFKVDVADTTGAGDAFNGGLATALAEGKPIGDAIRFAGATAALCITKTGTAKAMPERAEIDKLLNG